jgi:hypothetical protein
MLQHASTWDNCEGSFFVSLTKKESTPKSLSQSFANVSGLEAFKTPDLLVQELQENINVAKERERNLQAVPNILCKQQRHFS